MCTKRYFYSEAIHLILRAAIQDFAAKLQFNFANLREFVLYILFKTCSARRANDTYLYIIYNKSDLNLAYTCFAIIYISNFNLCAIIYSVG